MIKTILKSKTYIGGYIHIDIKFHYNPKNISYRYAWSI